MQLYLLDLFDVGSNIIDMDTNSCDTCNVSGNHLMDHCPECGDPFAYPTMGQKFRATLGIFGLLAIAAVFAL